MNSPNKYNCSGCMACMEICPQKAIIMEPDAFGFLYPTILQKKCINCNLCLKVCPFNTEYDKSQNLNKPICYGARNKVLDEIKTSRSGGVFVSISKWALEKKGIVYGAGYDNRFNVKHIRVDNIKDLSLLKGSKYVQSNLQYIYPLVETDLKKNLIVVFSGTPCQTAALHSYLSFKHIPQDNLYLIDVVCHGVPSTYIWRDYFHYIESKYKNKIVGVNFRDKSIFGWAWHEESFMFANKPKIYRNSYTSLFYTHLSIRYSCFNCKFANIQRPSDISLADFWEWKKCLPEAFHTDNLGISQILLNTNKGVFLFNEIKKDIDYIKADLDTSLQYAMKKATPEPKGRLDAEIYYKENGFIPFMIKYSNFSFYEKLKSKYRRLRSLIKLKLNKL